MIDSSHLQPLIFDLHLLIHIENYSNNDTLSLCRTLIIYILVQIISNSLMSEWTVNYIKLTNNQVHSSHKH